jgi:heme exporter protein D
MPDESFYAGLGLAEALRKFADHHYDPGVRHISLYEYQVLEQAAARIEGEAPALPPAIDEEAAADWTRLLQAYWTGIASQRTDAGFDIWSVPLRSATPSAVGVLGITVRQDENRLEFQPPEVAVAANTNQLQNILLGLLGAARAPRLEFLEPPPADLPQYEQLYRPTLQELATVDYELVNRALYQPSVPIEGSPPSFKSIQDVLAAAGGGGYVWLAHVHEAGPVAVLYLGMTIIVIRVSLALADRLAEGIQNWHRPKDEQ